MMKTEQRKFLMLLATLLVLLTSTPLVQAQDSSEAPKVFLPLVANEQTEDAQSTVRLDPALAALLAESAADDTIAVILWLATPADQAQLFSDEGTPQAAEEVMNAEEVVNSAAQSADTTAALAALDAQRADAVALLAAPVVERLQSLGYAATAATHAPMLSVTLTPAQIEIVAGWPEVALVSLDQFAEPAVETEEVVAPAASDEASAALAVDRAKGWVWANQQTVAACYTPSTSYQYNSSGATNRVCRIGAVGSGQYRVEFPGLGTASGAVQVAAYGGNHHCKVTSWGPSSTTQQVNVRCFTPAGTLIDGRFVILFYRESRSSTLWSAAYLWANQPTTATYTPAAAYQWNAKGNSNTVRRLAIGQYQARLPGLNLLGGTVLVTAYGTGAERCKVGSWTRSGSDTLVSVYCFNGTAAVDTMYTLAYMRDVGIGVRFAEEQHFGAYLWANNATSTACYTPSTTYQFNMANSNNTACRLAVGAYRVRLPRLKTLNRTAPQVTAYGTTNEYCTINRWSSDGSGGTYAYVDCFSAAGVAVDTRFTLLYLTDTPINAGARTSYMADCRTHGVPVPPDWAESGTPWVLQGTLTQNLLQPGQFAAVWSYSDPSTRGACIALPRGSGNPGTLAGIICQSATTGAACFWDNKLRSDSSQTGLGWRGVKLTISTLHDGTTLNDNCTGCHRGNNVYLISPDDPTWAKVLRGPLSGHSTGTFTTRVESSSDNTGGHPRYIPITTVPDRPGWQNPFAAGGCAGACHEMPVVSSPPMPPACALPSTTNPANCYGTP